MTAERQALVERVRAALPRDRALREVSMFGGLAFMLDNRMVVSVNGDGGMLVRVDPKRSGELVARPGAQRAQMGANRTMGPGWISVAAAGLETDQQLTDWIDVALQHHSTQAATNR